MKSFAEVNLKGTWNFPKNKFFWNFHSNMERKSLSRFDRTFSKFYK